MNGVKRIIIRSKQQAANSLTSNDDEGLVVDLTGELSSDNIYQCVVDVVERPKLVIQPDNNGILILSVKKFYDGEESSSNVSYVVSCVLEAAKALGCNIIYINCKAGQNRAPLIACRVIAMLEGHYANEPGAVVFDVFKRVCSCYCKKYMDEDWTKIEDRPEKMPRFCYPIWASSNICRLARSARLSYDGPRIVPNVEFEVPVLHFTKAHEDRIC